MQCFTNSAEIAFGSTKNVQQPLRNKPWFNRECRDARRKFHLAKRVSYKHNSIENKEKLKTMSKNYKRTMDKCIKNYRNGISRKLSMLRSTKSKEYWKVLNSGDKKVLLLLI